MSDVRSVDANGEKHENWHGSLGSVMDSRTSQPLVLNIIQCSRHVQRFLRCVREGVRKKQNIVEKVALETAKTATEESTVSLSEVVLGSQSEYGQTKSVKIRRPQRGRYVIRCRIGKERDR